MGNDLGCRSNCSIAANSAGNPQHTQRTLVFYSHPTWENRSDPLPPFVGSFGAYRPCQGGVAIMNSCIADFMHSALTMRFVLVFKMTAWGWTPGVSRLRGIMMMGKARVVGVLAAVSLMLAGCSSGDISGPTTTGSIMSSSPTTAASTPVSSPQSTASAAPSSSAVLSTTSASSSSNPWPSTFTPDQRTAAAAAIAGYTDYWSTLDQAFAAPGQDWSSQVSAVAAAAEKDGILQELAALVKRGQRSVGSTGFEPEVTQVDPGVVSLTACVDKTAVNFVDATGQSIKAPNAPGSYFRHVSTAQIVQFQDQWLVTVTSDDWTRTC